jgi:hypothetical protein
MTFSACNCHADMMPNESNFTMQLPCNCHRLYSVCNCHGDMKDFKSVSVDNDDDENTSEGGNQGTSGLALKDTTS